MSDFKFRLERKNGSSDTWELVEEFWRDQADDYEYEDSGLATDTEYTYRIKAIDPEDSGWSAEDSITTVEAVVHVSDPSPAQDEEVNVGIIEFSAVVESDAGNDCRLHVKIADNEDMTGASEYISAWVASGERASIDHNLATTGTHYVEMQAEDTDNDESWTLEYSFTAIQLLYFLETPRVETRGPIATHITVRSKETGAEATAEDGTVASDKRIERLVEIDDGDASVCQEVADRLLARWGEEQVSVSGDINLTVTLDFKQKVSIIIPEAGLGTVDTEELQIEREEDTEAHWDSYYAREGTEADDDDLVLERVVIDEL